MGEVDRAKRNSSYIAREADMQLPILSGSLSPTSKPTDLIRPFLVNLVSLLLLSTCSSGAPEATKPITAEPDFAISEQFYSEHLKPVTLIGCELERMGRDTDGGYINCASDLGSPQVAFSYGIGGRDSWGCDVAEKYQIPVYQYDPFDLRVPPCNKNLKDQSLTRFLPVGVAGKTYTDAENIGFETFLDSLRVLDISGKALVKMDIEGKEWLSLERVLEDGSYARITQLILEIHGLQTTNRRRGKLIKKVLAGLNRHFHVVHIHTNNYACNPIVPGIRANVLEISYVNRNIPNMKVKPKQKPSFPTSLDSPNNPNAADCPIDDDLFTKSFVSDDESFLLIPASLSVGNENRSSSSTGSFPGPASRPSVSPARLRETRAVDCFEGIGSSVPSAYYKAEPARDAFLPFEVVANVEAFQGGQASTSRAPAVVGSG